MDITKLLKEFIGVRSDSGTALECDMAVKLLSVIREMPYFKAHPSHFGTFDFGDALRRPIVWALIKGRSERTLVLTGHYDAVNTACYGKNEKAALDPDALTKAVLEDPGADPELREDLASGEWLPGRGSNDMKAGLAIALSAMDAHDPEDLSLLFVAVCDEENLSAGARGAGKLYRELHQRFGLKYELGIILEPSEALMDDPAVPAYNGSCGKILPVMVVKGCTCHGARAMEGLSAVGLLSRIVLKTELDPALISEDQGVFTQPPAVLMQRDLKDYYDVSLPEYAGAAISITFLKSTRPLDLIGAIKGRAAEGLAEGIQAYEATYRELAELGAVRREGERHFTPSVFTCGELTALVREQEDGEAFLEAEREKMAAQIADRSQNMVGVTLLYIRDLMHKAGVAPGSCAIGIAPPYYPAANNDHLGAGAAEMIRDLVQALSPAVSFFDYSQGITDMSYLSCSRPEEEEEILENVPLAGDLYDIDFRLAAEYGFPCLKMGPRGKCLHQEGERVYLPDLTETVPGLLRQIITIMERP